MLQGERERYLFLESFALLCQFITTLEEHPQIKSKIEERIRNVPEVNRERAFINAAMTETMNQTVRTAGNRVRP
jgi:hypothetical protein